MRIIVLALPIIFSAACQQGHASKTHHKQASEATCTGGGDGSCCSGIGAAELADKKIPADAVSFKVKVTGMHCSSCEKKVKAALLKLEDVYTAEMNSDTGIVTIQAKSKVEDKAIAAIKKLGYGAESA